MLPPHLLISIPNVGPAVLILGTKRQEVVGEFYRSEQVHTAYNWASASIEQGDNKSGQANTLAWLIREPSNPHDPQAVAIFVGGYQVGYLPRDAAAHWSPIVVELERRSLTRVCCVARFERPRDDVRNVWLMLTASING